MTMQSIFNSEIRYRCIGGVHFLACIPGRMICYPGTKHIPGSRTTVWNILQTGIWGYETFFSFIDSHGYEHFPQKPPRMKHFLDTSAISVLLRRNSAPQFFAPKVPVFLVDFMRLASNYIISRFIFPIHVSGELWTCELSNLSNWLNSEYGTLVQLKNILEGVLHMLCLEWKEERRN